MSDIALALAPRLRPFVSLSYPAGLSASGQQLYGKGRDDVYYVLFWAIAFTALRHMSMHYVLSPLARLVIPPEPVEKAATPALQRHTDRAAARRREHNVIRFAEQAWGMLYCTVFWSIGVTILRRIPNATSPQQVWGTYPVTPLPALTKFYYLAQLGWWCHQVYVINTEKRRKDYWQMFFHHFLSIALISCSYMANYTRVGVVVHVLMDLCDILLPLAKLLRYMNFRTACDGAFVAFLVAWICTRQIGLFLVIRSAYVEAPRYIPFQWSPHKGMYLTPTIYYGFIALLSVLLLLCSIWFYMAIMVAVRVVRGQGAEDSRSDDEDEGDDDAVSVDSTDVEGVSSAVQVNGYANGHANGNTNGSNGVRANGNGHAANGYTNGSNGANGAGVALKHRK